MASTFWVGSNVKVTNNSDTVEVTAGDVISKVKESAAFVASNFSLPYEVDRTYTTGGKDYIVLKEVWAGASGTGLNAVAITSPAGIEEARQTLLSLISTYESFANSVKPTVENNAVVQRTSSGRIKTANAVSSDEAVAFGQLGSAATKNVGSSAGNVMEFGASGLGLATTQAESITDFNPNKGSGFFRSIGSVTDAPETATFNSSVTISPASTGTNFLYQRNVSNSDDIKAWLGCTRPQTNDVSWVELYHSGNSVNPLDYGLGVEVGSNNAPQISNADTQKRTGFFRTVGGEAGTPVSSGIGSIINLDRSAGTSRNQIYVRGDETNNKGQAFFRGGNDASFTDWFELYHSSNSVNPLDYGLKRSKGVVGNNVDNTTASGFYFGYGGSHSNNPSSGDNPFPSSAGVFSLTVSGEYFSEGSGEYVTQVVMDNSSVLSMKIRQKASSAGGWTPWQELYHSGNTNFNEFGGNGAGERVATCTARGTTTVFIELPLNSKVPATGASTIGSFSLSNQAGGIIATGITSSDIGTVTNTRPSSRLYTLLVNNLTGLTGNDTYYLETESSDAKITVNF